jgi:hypothetical protein
LEADQVLGEQVFARSVRKIIVDATANVATPEDLIVLKTLADRPIDRRDIAELREIFGDALDDKYIDGMLSRFQ